MARLGFMRDAERYADFDQAALYRALLRLKTCPNNRCRRELQPVAFSEDVWGCATCKETWHIIA